MAVVWRGRSAYLDQQALHAARCAHSAQLARLGLRLRLGHLCE